MTSFGAKHFESCNLRTLDSNEAVLLSGCWKLERVKMTHRDDGKVDLELKCHLAQCLCARALEKSKACVA
ncbi:MAG TPA: hypothetical protein VKP60_03295, partial [Magnetospirillaceae bacterium]|nr:hypothetical protein [Magnetospirillaceae bacterium]